MKRKKKDHLVTYYDALTGTFSEMLKSELPPGCILLKLAGHEHKGRVWMKTQKTPKPSPTTIEDLPEFRATMDVMRTEEFFAQIRNADVVLTKPTSPEWNPQIAYGKAKLEEIQKSGTTTRLAIMTLIIDWTSDEPEALTAILLTEKGSSDLTEYIEDTE